MPRPALSFFLGWMILAGGSLPLLRADELKGPALSLEQALERLKEGNKRFVADQMAARPAYPEQRAKLAAKQKPFAVVLTCADSRVVPELIFNQQLGDLFVLRLAGNVTDPSVLGSIEYAVAHVHPSVIVVLGHTNCGAVRAKVDGEHLEGNIAELIKRVHVGKDLPTDKKAAVAEGVKNNVLYHARQLSEQSALIKEFVATGRVHVAAGVCGTDTGAVSWLPLSAAKAPKKH